MIDKNVISELVGEILFQLTAIPLKTIPKPKFDFTRKYSQRENISFINFSDLKWDSAEGLQLARELTIIRDDIFGLIQDEMTTLTKKRQNYESELIQIEKLLDHKSEDFDWDSTFEDELLPFLF